MPIAAKHGLLYGKHLPGKLYDDLPLYFADQDWKKPNREKYMLALKKHKPIQATVLDLESEDQFDTVMSWAEEAAQYVKERFIIIPKVFGIIDRIPEKIGGKDVLLGYSVPTKYAGTELPVWEFKNRPVHLLGGSPQKQINMLRYLNVFSADGNYIQMMANKFCAVWTETGSIQLQEMGMGKIEKDAPYFAFDYSCQNWMAAWEKANRELGYD